MISASKEFKEKLKNGANVVNYADITLSDGTVLNLTYKDFMIGGCTIEDKTTDGKFGVGFVIGKTLSLRIANHNEQFSQYDFYNSIINLYVALALNDGTVEKIRKGIYYTTVPETPGDVIELSAVDGMYLLDRDYSASTTAYPATLQTIISDACLDCGIPIGFTQFSNMNFIVQEKPEGVTYRQVVSYASQIAGYNARIDNNGYMQLIWYKTALLDSYNYVGGDFKVYPHDTVIDGGNFTDYSTGTIISGGTFTDEAPEHIFRIKTLDVHTDDVQITGVRVVGEDDVTALFGEEGYLIEIKDNPFVNGQEQHVADYLGNRIVGMIFRPFTAQVLNNPLYDPFEIVKVSDRKGNAYLSIINSISYTIGAYTQIGCEAEDPVRNGSTYVSNAAKAVVEARRNAEKQLTTYDKVVQNMNQLAMNAMGFHTTYEEQLDGSRITYLHDKSELSESTIIYKQTIDGFFISQDGGKSYTAGFDTQGNAVFNIIAAIGIVFDWAKGGTLTLGGENNINGDMIVYDSAENIVGRFNKDGLWASNGYFEGTIKSKNAEIIGGYININTSSAKYDVIRLNYSNSYSSLSPYQISVVNGTNSFYGSAGSITLSRGSITTHIQGDTASFGSNVSVLGNLFVSGKTDIGGDIGISGKITTPVTFGYAVSINGTGSLTLDSSATFECRSKATFYNGIYEGTVFSVDTVGNVTANGAIKSTGNYTSSLYTLELINNLSVNGATTLRGSIKLGDSTGDYIGFFGGTGSGKKTVSTITSTSSATSSSNATKINEIINALKAYNLL